MKKVELHQSHFDLVPSQVVCDIFSRLPTKTCLNCKVVCKNWYHIITDPEFAALRCSHGCYLTLLLCNGKMNIQLLDLDKSSSKVDEMGNLKISADALIKFKPRFNIDNLLLVNECNGVICLEELRHLGRYVICNLLTRQYMVVKQSCTSSDDVRVYGLGCCLVSHQFKLLRLKSKDQKNYAAEVLTLGTNDWRRVDCGPPSKFCWQKSAVFLNGSLHRLSCEDNAIWSFHFGNEQFLHIPLPEETNALHHAEVSIYNSCLCVCVFFYVNVEIGRCEIWVMKEYGVKESWVKQFIFPIELRGLISPLLEVDGDKVIGCVDHFGHKILRVCANNDSGRLEVVKVPGVASVMFDSIQSFDAKFSKLQISPRIRSLRSGNTISIS